MVRTKKKTIFIGLGVILLLCIFGFMQSAEAQLQCPTDSPVMTQTITYYFSTATTVNGVALEVDDEVRAYVDDVDTNNSCVGEWVVTTQGAYGAMSVYGDDAATTGVKDGVQDGDTIRFEVCRDGYVYDFDQTTVWSSAYANDYREVDLTCASCCTDFYRDHDDDDYGSTNDMLCLVAPDGEYTATVGGDCDDNDPAVFPGEPCNDANPCTHTDTCSAGTCGGTAYTCEDNNVCTDNVCVGDGTCDYPPNTASCDDGDPCTHTDTCSAGTCGGTAYTCEDNDVCTDNVCVGDGTCDYPPNTASCDDGDACTHTDTCSAGTCGGTAYTCDDNNVCTDNVCVGDGTCDYPPNTASCDDGDACTHTDTCSAGTCAGTAYTCEDDNDCTVNTCLGDGTCDYPAVADGTSCDDGDACTEGDTCTAGSCDGSAVDCDDNNVCTYDSCDPNTGCLNLPDFVNVLSATGQEYDTNSQVVEVRFGQDPNVGSTDSDPEPNWSPANIVRLQLIDPNADIADPNNLVDPDDYLTDDIRGASEDMPILWYVMVEIGAEADSNQPDTYFPELSWDSLGCLLIDGNAYVYKLLSGLGDAGTVLVENMSDTNTYETGSQDGDPVQYFTIMFARAPEPEPEPEPAKPIVFPWPGVSRSLGWGLPMTAGFPGGLPYAMRSGYASGLSIPSFPGTYTGFSYPGGPVPGWTQYPSVTSYLPRFPVTFPTLGIFSPLGQYGWPTNYWSGYSRPFTYQTGWFYTYR